MSGGIDPERVRRIEESQAFAERGAEALTQQLVDLDKRLREVLTRLSRLESRVTDVAARFDDGADAGEDTTDVPNRDD